MGRPVNKKYFGETGGASPRVPARYHDGASSREGWIVSQKGTNKFKCDSTAGAETICRLVNEIAPNAEGEMSLVGLATDSNPVIVKKLFNRTAVDWNNNRYTWTVEDDSTESLLRLTAI
tara:strand:+ start:184 stop:540 length:357 start_codon:yes stop_codon:yes gene_type:complete